MYKQKQGRNVRGITFITFVALWLFAAYRAFTTFPDWEWARTRYLESVTIPLVDISTPVVNPAFLISLGIAGLLILLSAYACFSARRSSDFLIDTESEMKKVSWPTIKEVIKSSIVVIIAIIILAVYLFVVDIGLDSVFEKIF